ncbi:MAG: hypothetical protein AB8H80_01820 [Planctomycetota bacterium]
MRYRFLHAQLALLGLAGSLAAQQGPAGTGTFAQVRLRVAAVRPAGQVVVDRGSRDKVQVDDRVVLEPRGGQAQTGRVVQVDSRTALVQLLDPKANVPAGTRGHALVPRVRLEPAKPQPARPGEENPAEEGPTSDSTGAGEPPSQSGGEAADDGDEWQVGMPLLGRRRAPRPEERESRVHGRLYGRGNLVRTLDSFSQSFLVAGADFDINNVEGKGGTLRFHGEFVRSTEFSGNAGNDLRIYELSYERGGNRFEPWRLQMGRFLQRDVPEFGLLDGIEVGYRQENGDRFGVNLGYLPELDDDLESFADLAVSAWYVWNQDVGERVTYALAYQKTWHRLEGDRDLFLLKARFLPENGWDVSSSIWVDIYDNDDVIKDESVEVTRANLFASRRVKGEGGVELFYDREEYPELRRQENQQTLLPQTLAGAHVDRASARLWWHSGEKTQWFTRWTGWVDEEGEGGAGELGLHWFEHAEGGGARTGLAAYHIEALTSSVSGVRLEHGGTYDFGRLDLLYELGFAHFDDRPNRFNDLLQHRLGALVTTDLGSGWDASFNFDATLWDEEASFALGIYLQRLF